MTRLVHTSVSSQYRLISLISLISLSVRFLGFVHRLDLPPQAPRHLLSALTSSERHLLKSVLGVVLLHKMNERHRLQNKYMSVQT